jgi:hypothetical protein
VASGAAPKNQPDRRARLEAFRNGGAVRGRTKHHLDDHTVFPRFAQKELKSLRLVNPVREIVHHGLQVGPAKPQPCRGVEDSAEGVAATRDRVHALRLRHDEAQDDSVVFIRLEAALDILF